jgi:flagellar assembly factor FliW
VPDAQKELRGGAETAPRDAAADAAVRKPGWHAPKTVVRVRRSSPPPAKQPAAAPGARNGVRSMSHAAATADVLSLPSDSGSAAGVIEVQTTRFGTLTVEADRVLNFPRGLLGFPSYERYALIQAGDDNYFFWLQCVDEPSLAFVVTDPSIFFKTYEVPMKEETTQELGITDAAQAQVFVICNKVGEWLTGNLLGPIVVNAANRLAQQVVLTEKKWTTRQPLMQLRSQQQPLAKSA